MASSSPHFGVAALASYCPLLLENIKDPLQVQLAGVLFHSKETVTYSKSNLDKLFTLVEVFADTYLGFYM